MEQNIAFALSIVTMMSAIGAAKVWRRRMLAYRDALTALRRNCWVRNERQHFVRYANASDECRAAAETTKEN